MSKKEAYSQAGQQKLVNDIAAELHKLYPAYPWHVETSDDGSMVHILSPVVASVRKVGFAIPVREAQQAGPRRRLLVRAGGEYLESFNLSRTNQEQFTGLVDQRGDPIPVSGVTLQ